MTKVYILYYNFAVKVDDIVIISKICVTCNQEKPIEYFYKRKDSKDGYRNQCKDCKDLIDKNNKNKNRQYYLDLKKKYYLKNKENLSKKKREYYFKNIEYIKEKNKEYRENNKETLAEKNRQWQRNHKEYRCEKYHEKMQNELYRIKVNLRSSINNYLNNRGICKTKKTQEILGCTYEEFKNYIEQQFQEGMNWNNRGEWHLDHIIPMASAKNAEEAIKLCHYTNFRPLWAIDNLKKGAKIEGENI